jgi:hypothetical protein
MSLCCCSRRQASHATPKFYQKTPCKSAVVADVVATAVTAVYSYNELSKIAGPKPNPYGEAACDLWNRSVNDPDPTARQGNLIAAAPFILLNGAQAVVQGVAEGIRELALKVLPFAAGVIALPVGAFMGCLIDRCRRVEKND